MTSSYDTPEGMVARGVLDWLAEDDLFCEGFCSECEHVKVRSRDYECPAGWLVSDANCARSREWSDIKEVITKCITHAMKH